ncbi:hypothetical protein D3Q32_19605 [Salmonella enterica]|nr:hypothetical protein [Salmonella enterica]
MKSAEVNRCFHSYYYQYVNITPFTITSTISMVTSKYKLNIFHIFIFPDNKIMQLNINRARHCCQEKQRRLIFPSTSWSLNGNITVCGHSLFYRKIDLLKINPGRGYVFYVLIFP